MPDATESPRSGRGQLLLRWFRARRFRVADGSMTPTLVPGDCLYVDPRAYRARPPAVGDIVVTWDPAVPTRHLVKRVGFIPGGEAPPDGATVPPGSVYLLGDDPVSSRDSRVFGPVPTRLLVGRAYRCYRPVEHRRDL